MKVLYAAKTALPSNAASAVHIMKICEQFNTLTEGFCLVVGGKVSQVDEDCFNYYGVEKFPVKAILLNKSGAVSSYQYAIQATLEALKQKVDLVITRDPLTAFFSLLLGKEVVLDLHGEIAHLCGRAYRMIKLKWFVQNKKLHLVTITEGLRQYYYEKYQVPLHLMTVLPDGYTPENYSDAKPLKWNTNDPLQIGYCGSFFKGKGMELLQQLTAIDKENQYHFYGGDRKAAEKEVGAEFGDNVYFHGYIPNAKIPEELGKQHILLMPNQAVQICKNEDIGKVTSPLKMFEYMASRRIIIASDLPVLREILNDENSFLVEATNKESWYEAIQYVKLNFDAAKRKAETACDDVKAYSWRNRCEKMLQLCNNKKVTAGE